MSNENIIASVKVKKINYFVTDIRFIRVDSGSGFLPSKQIDDLSFKEVTSISLREDRSLARILIIIGIFLIGIGILFSYSYGLLFILTGVGITIIGLRSRSNYFQFTGSRILRDKKDAELWRLENILDPNVIRFVRAARDQIYKSETGKLGGQSVPPSSKPPSGSPSLPPTSKPPSASISPKILRPRKVTNDTSENLPKIQFDPNNYSEWEKSLLKNQGFEDSKDHVKKDTHEIQTLILKIIESSVELLDIFGDDHQIINNSFYRDGYLEGLQQIIKDKPKLEYNTGQKSAHLYYNKSVKDITELVLKIQNSDPSLLNIFGSNHILIVNENYRKGFLNKLEQILEEQKIQIETLREKEYKEGYNYSKKYDKLSEKYISSLINKILENKDIKTDVGATMLKKIKESNNYKEGFLEGLKEINELRKK